MENFSSDLLTSVKTMQVNVVEPDRKHGISFFYDFNMVGSNVCLSQAREFIVKVADWHGINLDKKLSNEQARDEYEVNFPDSPYAPEHWELKASLQPYELDIQNVANN